MKLNKICIYCGENPATEREHVISRCFFVNPRPSNLVTVPTCGDCNDSFQMDEEYFRSILAIGLELVANSQTVRSLLEGPVKRSLQRKNEGLFRLLQRDIQISDIVSSGGIYLGKAPTIPQDKKRIDNVIWKIVRGMYFKIYNERLPDDTQLHTIIDADDSQLLLIEQYFKSPRVECYGDGVFTYAMMKVAEMDGGTAWAMSFYGGYYVLAVTVPEGHSLNARIRKWQNSI